MPLCCGVSHDNPFTAAHFQVRNRYNIRLGLPTLPFSEYPCFFASPEAALLGADGSTCNFLFLRS